jgi:hypothetical protein
MSLKTLVDEAIAEIEKLLTHTDPNVTAQAQTVAGKLDQIKTQAIADAEKLGSEAVADGKALLTEAGRDAGAIVSGATGSAPAAPAK